MAAPRQSESADLGESINALTDTYGYRSDSKNLWGNLLPEGVFFFGLPLLYNLALSPVQTKAVTCIGLKMSVIGSALLDEKTKD